MPEARINVPMNNHELTALLQMARADCRHPREQLRCLLRAEAERHGFLPAIDRGITDTRESASPSLLTPED